jgi:Tropinone reductase 1
MSPTTRTAARSWTGWKTSDGLHILVNNAGGNVTKAATEYSEDEWRKIFETNLFSAFELSRYAHPLLARHASSSIVNVGSVSGLTHAQRRGLRHDQGGDAPDDPQPGRRVGRGWHPGQCGGAWYIRTRRPVRCRTRTTTRK